MQAGGYAPRAMAMLSEKGREFVLNADTTRFMERNLGQLSQDKLRNAFGGSGGAMLLRTQHEVRISGPGAQYVPQSQLVELIRDTVADDIGTFVKAVVQ